LFVNKHADLAQLSLRAGVARGKSRRNAVCCRSHHLVPCLTTVPSIAASLCLAFLCHTRSCWAPSWIACTNAHADRRFHYRMVAALLRHCYTKGLRVSCTSRLRAARLYTRDTHVYTAGGYVIGAWTVAIVAHTAITGRPSLLSYGVLRLYIARAPPHIAARHPSTLPWPLAHRHCACYHAHTCGNHGAGHGDCAKPPLLILLTAATRLAGATRTDE